MADQHTLSTGRFQRGRSNWAGAGMSYGTSGRCSCGQTFRINEAPSKGGKRAIVKMHAEHVKRVS